MEAKRLSFLSILVICLVCSPCTARDVLYTGERLSAGQILINGINYLSMQFNCNLVFYSVVALWSSATAGQGTNCFATLLNNGTLVVNSGNGTRLWESGPGGETGNYVLAVQPDRNVAIYGPRVWATNTAAPPVALGKKQP